MAHDDGLVTRHEKEFTRIWQQVGALGNRMTAVEGTVERLDEDFYNHGRDGLKTQFTTFVAEARGAREEQEKQHRTNSAKLNAMLVIATIALVLIALATYVDTKRAGIIPSNLFHSQSLDPVYAFTRHHPQDAGSTIAVHF